MVGQGSWHAGYLLAKCARHVYFPDYSFYSVEFLGANNHVNFVGYLFFVLCILGTFLYSAVHCESLIRLIANFLMLILYVYSDFHDECASPSEAGWYTKSSHWVSCSPWLSWMCFIGLFHSVWMSGLLLGHIFQVMALELSILLLLYVENDMFRSDGWAQRPTKCLMFTDIPTFGLRNDTKIHSSKPFIQSTLFNVLVQNWLSFHMMIIERS